MPIFKILNTDLIDYTDCTVSKHNRNIRNNRDNRKYFFLTTIESREKSYCFSTAPIVPIVFIFMISQISLFFCNSNQRQTKRNSVNLRNLSNLCQKIIFQPLLILILHNQIFAQNFIINNNNNQKTKVFIEKVNETKNIIKAETFANDSLINTSKWTLDFPVFRFECGDGDNNGIDDIIVGVIKSVPYDTVPAKRLFIFKLYENEICPLWLSSRLSKPLVDFRFVANANKNYIRSIEKLPNNEYFVVEYFWYGFGLKFNRYLGEKISKRKAYKMLNNK